MTHTTKRTWASQLAAMTIAAALPLAGCGSAPATNSPTMNPGAAVTGTIYGGRQPVSGANIYLYAAGTAGYSSAATNLLTQSVQSDATGRFSLGGLYTCTSGQQLYIIASGGNPGAGANPQSALGVALGDCSTVSSSTTINVDEATTIALAYALAPFSTGYANIGAPTTNAAGLSQAFKSALKLVNASTGYGQGNVTAGATVPMSEVYALSNVLASCVNSMGGVAGDGSNCGSLFTLATPSGGSAPTDTFGLALAIAQNPTHNVKSIYNRIPTSNPYAPYLNAAPNDWTVSIVYSAGGFNTPQSTTIDANGQVYVANSGNNTVSVIAQNGQPVTVLTGNGLNTPSAVALDIANNIWVTNTAASTVSAFTSTGASVTGSPFNVGTSPAAIAFDAAGNAWVANSGSNSITELNASGSTVATYTSSVTAPTAIAINPH